MHRFPQSLATALSVFALLAASGSAQLDLPAPSGTTRAPKSSGFLPGLDLPDRAPKEPKTPAASAPVPVPVPEVSGSPAEIVLASLRTSRAVDGAHLRAALETLAGLGESGLAAARAALGSEFASELVAATRVLLAGGRAADRERVLERMRRPVPAQSAAPLVLALVELDPVGASPAFFAEELDHSQSSMRAAAASALSGRATRELVPALERRLASSRADTRERVVEIAAEIDDDAARELLFAALGDGAARVAYRAAVLLARSDAEGVEARLVALVVEGPYLLRAASYALLALVEREDARAMAILGTEHVALLLANLTSENDLAAGAAACALAGIGFRRPDADRSGWLDLLVPHHLVRAVAATEYHRDFTSLQAPAERRLSLIAGFTLGSDGPAWQRWWGQAALAFRARRALLVVDPLDLGGLWLAYASPDEAFRLCGERVPAGASTGEAETFLLTREECGDLLRTLEREQVLGADRLPSIAAAGERPKRTLVVGNGIYEKRFSAPAGAEPWFERSVAFAHSLRDANAWQRWVDPRRHADRRELWLAEREFWRETTDPRARARRSAELVLAALAGADDSARSRGLAELERLYGEPGAVAPSDVRLLVDLIAKEPSYGAETGRLVALALVAARADEAVELDLGDAGPGPGGRAASSAETALDGKPAIPGELAEGLVAVLAERFGADTLPEIALVRRSEPARRARLDALSSGAVRRAGAALALGADASTNGEELLLLLLDDPDEVVVAAAVTAVGEQMSAHRQDREQGAHAREVFADPLLERTTSAWPAVRRAAFRALPGCGDDRTVGALLRGLSDEDAQARHAAALGMASLGDPETLPILLSMLARGPRSELFGPAREGLVGLGAAAHEELLRVLHRGGKGTGVELAREAALILAEGGVAEAASPLFAVLTDDPSDARVAWELSVLTCVDLRERPDPAGAWWEWWDGAVHDDSLVWLLAAGARAGLAVPERAAFDGRGTRGGAAFLFDLAVGPEAHVALRARRELERRLGHTLELPSSPARTEPSGTLSPSEREALRALRERILAEGFPE